MEFIRNSYNGFYLSKALRKSSNTVTFILEIIQELQKQGWEIREKGIWSSIGNEEESYSDIEQALLELQDNRRFAIIINLVHESTSESIFIRWLNSSPQKDVLTIDGGMTIQDNIIVESTAFNRVQEVKQIVENLISSRITDEDLRPLSQEFIETQQINTLEILEIK